MIFGYISTCNCLQSVPSGRLKMEHIFRSFAYFRMLGDILSTNSKDVSSFEDLCSLLYIIIDSRKYLVGDMGCVCRMKDIYEEDVSVLPQCQW